MLIEMAAIHLCCTLFLPAISAMMIPLLREEDDYAATPKIARLYLR